MSSNGTSTEKTSWQQIKQLVKEGVTSTKELCHHTGLAVRTVQVLRKKAKELLAFKPTVKQLPSGGWMHCESPTVTHFLSNAKGN